MTSRRLTIAAILACCLFVQTLTAQEPPAAPPEAEAERLFIERLNDYAQTYLADAPFQAREFQEAVRQFQGEQAEKLLRSLNLPPQAGRLTDEQIRGLEKIELQYRDTEGARTAAERLREHFRIVDEPKAQEALKAIRLPGSADEELSPEQAAQLEKLREQFPLSNAARVASAALGRQRQRDADRALQTLIREYLETPGARAALDRFLERRIEFAMTLVESQRKQRLEEMLKNFPDIPAAQKVRPILAEINQGIADRRESDRFAARVSARYRDYWDQRYPSRLWVAPGEQKSATHDDSHLGEIVPSPLP